MRCRRCPYGVIRRSSTKRCAAEICGASNKYRSKTDNPPALFERKERGVLSECGEIAKKVAAGDMASAAACPLLTKKMSNLQTSLLAGAPSGAYKGFRLRRNPLRSPELFHPRPQHSGSRWKQRNSHHSTVFTVRRKLCYGGNF